MSPDEMRATAPEDTADTYQNINAGRNADGANGTQGDRAGEGGDGQTAGYASAYPTYNERGWPNTLKLRRGIKKPPPAGFTGYAGVTPSAEQKAQWAAEHPDGNLIVRLQEGYVGLDIDHYGAKQGGKTLAEAEKRWGKLPPTYTSTSRDDGVSGVRIFTIPKGVKLAGLVEFPELGLGDIEVIQRHHRYVTSWPSMHPEGRLYQWRDPGWVVMDGPPRADDIVAELPPAWVEGLAVRPRAKGKKNKDKPRIIEDTAFVEVPYVIERSLTDGEMSAKVALRLAEAVTHCYGGSRHDHVLRDTLALMRYGERGEPGVFEAMSALMKTFVHALAKDRPGGEQEAEDEFMRMLSNETAARLLSEGDDDEDEKSDRPKRWAARDLEAPKQPQWLAKQRLPRASVSLLVGDEGIGKSLLAITVIAHITRGCPFPGFGIPAREPGRVLLVLTEDDWSTEVRPRLEAAGADLDMIEIICTDKDGSGSPVFPRDIELIAAEPHPDLVVVDCWLDTVPSNIQVKDPQGARQALHPWKDLGTRTGAAIWLLCHTNRVATGRPRDKYGVTSELRKKARLTVFCQSDEDGNLVAGPEKANGARIVCASKFVIKSVPFFEPTEDHDGTVPELLYLGESTRTATEHLADNYAEERDSSGNDDAVAWLATLLANGPVWSTDAHAAREGTGFSKNKFNAAKKRLHVGSDRDGENGPWFMRLPQHNGQVPAPQNPGGAPGSGPLGFWDSGGILENPEITSTSQDSLNPNGDTHQPAQDSGKGAPPSSVPPPPTSTHPAGDSDDLRRALLQAAADPPANTGNGQHRPPHDPRNSRSGYPAKHQPGRRAGRKAQR